MANAGIYIHIPFCLRKCFYCDFFSVPTDDPAVRKSYADALIKEIEFYGVKYGKAAGGGMKIDSLFFGGGTPSLMEPELIASVLEAVRENFDVTADCEISAECNPATLSASKLAGYKAAGINRLSIGAQSFDDEILQNLGRVHRASDIGRTVTMAREAGFDNLSLDLMFAVPGQDMAKWKKSLARALELKPQHLSFYSLEIAENTVFGRMFERGELKETPVESDRGMYSYAIDTLQKAGYRHYEISNAALPGRECRHNMKYWDFSDYIGIGAGAHSFVRGARYSNVANLEVYIDAMRGQAICAQAVTADCAENYYINKEADSAAEYVFTALRTEHGVVFEDFERKIGRKFWNFYSEVRGDFDKFVSGGFAVSDDRHIALTRKGIDISNKIMAIFV